MKKNLKAKILTLAASASMAFLLAACGGGGNPTTTTSADAGAVSVTTAAPLAENKDKSDETLTVMLAAEPTSLSGMTGVQDVEGLVVQYATMARLFEFDYDKGVAVPSLAAGYEKIDDTHYRITLKDNIKYADGTPITAADVAYTLTKFREVENEWARHFKVDEFVVEDDKNIVIAFDTYVPGWDVGLTEAEAGIVSEKAVEAVGGVQEAMRKMPLSAGRYNFTEWKAGEYILIERNDNYWDESYTGYYKNIKFIWASDSASRLLAIKSGDADVAETITVSEASTLQNDPNAKAMIFPSSAVFNVYFNNSKGPFTDPKLREAVSYLIDSEGINQLMNMGMGEVAQGFIPKKAGEFYKEYYPNGVHPYDVEKAKELLVAAGYAEGSVTLNCIVLKSNTDSATVIQEALRNVGITMNITSVEPANYVPEARAGNYDLTIGANDNGYRSPDNFKLVDAEKPYDVIGGPKITDEKMIDIMKRGNSSDHATAVQGWHDAIDYLFDNHSLVGLYGRLICAATGPKLDGLKITKREIINVTELRPAP